MDLQPLRKEKKEAKPKSYLLESIRPGTRRQRPGEDTVSQVPLKGCLPRSPRVGPRGPRRLQGWNRDGALERGRESKRNSRSVLSACHLEPSRTQQGSEDCQVLPHRTLWPGRKQGPGFFMSPYLWEPLTGSDLWSLTPATTTGHAVPAQGVLQWGNS